MLMVTLPKKKTEKAGTATNLFVEASIRLMPKLDKHTKRKL